MSRLSGPRRRRSCEPLWRRGRVAGFGATVMVCHHHAHELHLAGFRKHAGEVFPDSAPPTATVIPRRILQLGLGAIEARKSVGVAAPTAATCASMVSVISSVLTTSGLVGKGWN